MLSINDALMNEPVSATHEGKHTVYLFMQTGTGHFIFLWRREVRAPYSAGASQNLAAKETETANTVKKSKFTGLSHAADVTKLFSGAIPDF